MEDIDKNISKEETVSKKERKHHKRRPLYESDILLPFIEAGASC